MFDLILTKEITRFARNTLDSISFTRRLLLFGVGVFFQNDNILTFDEDSELRLTIMSGIAQDELRKLSSRVKFGHAQAIKKGRVLGNGRIFGYRMENARLIIDEKEAPMIVELFELYGSGQYSFAQLENYFWDKGYRNHKGNKIAHSTLAEIIRNPKYKGFYVGNKVKVVDLFTKKQKFLPESEWVMYKDETGEIVPAIVSEEVWEQANKVLKRRSELVKTRPGIANHPNLVTGKMVCTCCGKPYYLRYNITKQYGKVSRWVCSNKIHNGANACPSFAIYEEELKAILRGVFEEAEDVLLQQVDEYIEMLCSMSTDTTVREKIQKGESALSNAEAKRTKILQMNLDGIISDRDFKQMNEQIGREIEQIKAELDQLDRQQEEEASLAQRMATLKEELHKARKFLEADGVVTKSFVDKFIKEIRITPTGERSADIHIILITDAVIQKCLERCKSHSGVMFTETGVNDENTEITMVSGDESHHGVMVKKMIEAYENGLK